MTIYCETGTQQVVGDTAITLSGVIPDHLNRAYALVWVSDNGSTTTGADYWTGMCELTGASELTVYVTGATASPRTQVSYCVVWCTEDEFYTEYFSGSYLTAGTTDTSTLSHSFSDATRRMIVGETQASTTQSGNQVYSTFEFSDATTVLATRGATGAVAYYAGWAILWRAETGVIITTGEMDLAGTIQNGTTTTHGSSVSDKTRQALFQNTRHEVAGLEQLSVSSYLSSGTQIWWERYDQATSYQSYSRWFLVAFPTGGIVCQSEESSATGTGLTASITLSAVDLDHTAITDAKASCNGTGTTYARHRWTFTLGSTTTVNAERWFSGQGSELGATVADFSNWKFSRQPHMVGRGF